MAASTFIGSRLPASLAFTAAELFHPARDSAHDSAPNSARTFSVPPNQLAPGRWSLPTRTPASPHSKPATTGVGKVVAMANPHEGKGFFAPLVVTSRNLIGQKRFNQIRGKAIAVHSGVIAEFCVGMGVTRAQRQGLIRLAKANGAKLGFLA